MLKNRLFRVFNLLKRTQNKNLKILLTKIEDHLNVHPGIFRLFKLIFLVVLASHTAYVMLRKKLTHTHTHTHTQNAKQKYTVCRACVWIALPSITENTDSWLTAGDFDFSEEPTRHLYIASLYWAFTALTTVGFGDVIAGNESERMFSIFTMAIGVTFYAYATATVSSVLHSLDLVCIMCMYLFVSFHNVQCKYECYFNF